MQIYSTTLLPAIPSDIAELYPLPDVSFPSFEKITAGTLWLSSLNQGKQLLQERCVWAILCLLQRKCLYLYDHCLRVQYLASHLAHSLSLPQTEIATIELAALLHDTGKLLFSRDILQKPGKLTQQEFEEVKKHSALGARLLRGMMMPENIISLVYHHHERWDGSDYPDGIAGETIPLGARIITVCDAFDAMASQRPYHHPITPAQALTQLKCCAGTQFDPFLTHCFWALFQSVSAKSASD